MATSNVTRVRKEGFSKISAILRPFSGWLKSDRWTAAEERRYANSSADSCDIVRKSE
jgi:hypothetical protein